MTARVFTQKTGTTYYHVDPPEDTPDSNWSYDALLDRMTFTISDTSPQSSRIIPAARQNEDGTTWEWWRGWRPQSINFRLFNGSGYEPITDTVVRVSIYDEGGAVVGSAEAQLEQDTRVTVPATWGSRDLAYYEFEWFFLAP